MFYPQGVIVSFENHILGVANYEECRESTTPNKLYPNHKVQALIGDYDEKNLWLVLKEARIID